MLVPPTMFAIRTGGTGGGAVGELASGRQVGNSWLNLGSLVQARTGLDPDDVNPGLGQDVRGDAAGGTQSDDDDVGLRQWVAHDDLSPNSATETCAGATSASIACSSAVQTSLIPG